MMMMSQWRPKILKFRMYTKATTTVWYIQLYLSAYDDDDDDNVEDECILSMHEIILTNEIHKKLWRTEWIFRVVPTQHIQYRAGKSFCLLPLIIIYTIIF